MTKNIAVTDIHGNNIGTTYPKRARGLVKSGRACFVDDCTIRLSASMTPSDYKKSEEKHMNYILFNPRGWFLDEATRHNNQNNQFQNGMPFGKNLNFNINGRRFDINTGEPDFNPEPFTFTQNVETNFISDFDPNKLVEMVQIGDWGNRRFSIVSDEFTLHPDTDYAFVFWLNGGENEKGDEECQLHITYSRQMVYPSIYKLNRSFIKPLLHYQGWELYQIPFHTAAGEQDIITQFRFVAKGAPLAIKAAKTPEEYKDIEDSPDPYAAYRPQRHNLVFEDGWPSINMYGGNKYSTEIVKRLSGAKVEGNNVDMNPQSFKSSQSVIFYQPDEDDPEDDDEDDCDEEDSQKNQE